jgi:hypothetical protein
MQLAFYKTAAWLCGGIAINIWMPFHYTRKFSPQTGILMKKISVIQPVETIAPCAN